MLSSGGLCTLNEHFISLVLLNVCFWAQGQLSSGQAGPSLLHRKLNHQCCTSYLSHLLLSLSFGCLSVGIVVSLDQNEVVGLWVDDKFPGSVLQRKGHLVEDSSQFLQSQDSARQRGGGGAVKNNFNLTGTAEL